MSLATAGLNYLFAPSGSFGWIRVPLLPFAIPAALLASISLDVGGVTEKTGWRGFALPLLHERMTPLAASLVVGVLWGVWHFPARPDILLGAHGVGGGALLLVILIVRFVFLSVVMTYFYNRAGAAPSSPSHARPPQRFGVLAGRDHRRRARTLRGKRAHPVHAHIHRGLRSLGRHRKPAWLRRGT
jgi:hypothetical protein